MRLAPRALSEGYYTPPPKATGDPGLPDVWLRQETSAKLSRPRFALAS